MKTCRFNRNNSEKVLYNQAVQKLGVGIDITLYCADFLPLRAQSNERDQELGTSFTQISK